MSSLWLVCFDVSDACNLLKNGNPYIKLPSLLNSYYCQTCREMLDTFRHTMHFAHWAKCDFAISLNFADNGISHCAAPRICQYLDSTFMHSFLIISTNHISRHLPLSRVVNNKQNFFLQYAGCDARKIRLLFCLTLNLMTF